MENAEFTPKRTAIILCVVVGCFGVLVPKVFYPMFAGTSGLQADSSDRLAGCCDVISETDIQTIKIMTELCKKFPINEENKPLNRKEILVRCRKEVLETCGIDISVVLQEQVRLGQSVKQILDEIRSLNGSLCLKYNFGVAPWRLGVPHRVTLKLDLPSVRQERPTNIKDEMLHPAFKERGRAIPHPQSHPTKRAPPKILDGRPGPLPSLRPTIGGPGHVVPASKQSSGNMGIIMPVYTVGIVIFFAYTLMKIIMKKQPDTNGDCLYPPVKPDMKFRNEVFSSRPEIRKQSSRENSCKLVVNAMSALLDEVDQELDARHKANDITTQNEHLLNGNLSNKSVLKEEEKPSVKIMGMETTASCEGGKKWPETISQNLKPTPVEIPEEPETLTQEIYLEGSLPAQSQLLVTNSAVETEKNNDENPAVVLAGKMTLSVISLDGESGVHAEDICEEDFERDTERKETSADEYASEVLENEIDELINTAIENVYSHKEESNSNIIEEILKDRTNSESVTVISNGTLAPSISHNEQHDTDNQNNLVEFNNNENGTTENDRGLRENNINKSNGNEIEISDEELEESEESEEEIIIYTDEEIDEEIEENGLQDVNHVNHSPIGNVNVAQALLEEENQKEDEEEIEDEEEEEEEIIEEIIEEYTDDEEELENGVDNLTNHTNNVPHVPTDEEIMD